MYLVYIKKSTYIHNLEEKINLEEDKLKELNYKLEHDNVGKKLKKEEDLINSSLIKYKDELKYAKTLDDITYIASMITITKYKEVVSLSSGMDNNYRKFNPKYVMYPKMIEDAFSDKIKYVNFLGIKNPFNKEDKDYGIYEVKRGFGGKTVEYIGEFDFPINKVLYYTYKIIRKIKRK